MIIDKKELFEIADLDEIPDKMDIDIKLPVKKVPEAMKTVPKKDSKTISLF